MLTVKRSDSLQIEYSGHIYCSLVSLTLLSVNIHPLKSAMEKPRLMTFLWLVVAATLAAAQSCTTTAETQAAFEDADVRRAYIAFT